MYCLHSHFCYGDYYTCISRAPVPLLWTETPHSAAHAHATPPCLRVLSLYHSLSNWKSLYEGTHTAMNGIVYSYLLAIPSGRTPDQVRWGSGFDSQAGHEGCCEQFLPNHGIPFSSMKTDAGSLWSQCSGCESRKFHVFG